MNTTKRMRLAVIPAAFAALALAGCQDEAPTTVAPTAGQQSTAQSAPTAETPASAPTTEAPAPSTTEAPAPSTTEAPAPGTTGAPASGVKCDSDSSAGGVKGSTATKPAGSAQTFSGMGYNKDTSIEINLGKPTIDSTSKDSYFPGDGMVTITFPVTLQLKSGSYYTTTPLSFTMVDSEENPCDRDQLGAVIPKSKQLPIESLKGTDKISGTLAYAVPAGADLKKYFVVWSENGGGKSDLAWSAN